MANGMSEGKMLAGLVQFPCTTAKVNDKYSQKMLLRRWQMRRFVDKVNVHSLDICHYDFYNSMTMTQWWSLSPATTLWYVHRTYRRCFHILWKRTHLPVIAKSIRTEPDWTDLIWSKSWAQFSCEIYKTTWFRWHWHVLYAYGMAEWMRIVTVISFLPLLFSFSSSSSRCFTMLF